MSKRRKSEDTDLTSPGPSHDAKTARFSKFNESLGDGDVGYWERRPGMIMEVKMRNFMCHQVKRFLITLYHSNCPNCTVQSAISFAKNTYHTEKIFH